MINVGTLHDPDYHLQEVTHDSVAYYMREGETPGRWAGSGATALGLSGEVTSGPIHDLFDGKNPNTGEYLIPSKGSNRRARDRRGERVVDVKAAAAQLGIKPDRVRDLLSRGKLAGTKKGDGHWEVPQQAIDAYRRGDQQPPAGPRNLKPAADGTVSLAQAAEIADVSSAISARSRSRRSRRPWPTPPTCSTCWRSSRAGRGGSTSTRWPGSSRPATRPGWSRRTTWRCEPPSRSACCTPWVSSSPQNDVARCHLAPGETVTSVVLSCHQAAVADVVGFLERHAAFVRGPGGKVAAAGLTAAVWDHRAARDGAPLLHSHITIVNAAVGVDGRRSALDGTALYAWARASGHVYQAGLRRRMVERLGVEFDQPHNGTADVAGVPRETVLHFSQRRRESLEFMARLGAEGPDALSAAVLATRSAKNTVEHGQPPTAVLAEAESHGLPRQQLGTLVGRGPRRALSADQLGRIAADLASPAGLTEKASVVDVVPAVRPFVLLSRRSTTETLSVSQAGDAR